MAPVGVGRSSSIPPKGNYPQYRDCGRARTFWRALNVISPCDAGDGGFSDALNLACDWCREWGYAPFG
jgi:hypothetical protein